ncbi:type II toxin-antitoxin system HicA family toxin [Candidatus Poriferisocius sp.]|uniref:type II toxin-antitoxin system HicA family toxin n=1 Tax=Candidatus Poriferisocius sp. TaxID=3101276 RepID=UPI003B526894
MTGRLDPVSRRALIKRLWKLGWEGPIAGKRHEVMRKGKHKVPIPNPGHRGDIGPGLVNQILKQASITKEEWQKASN